MTRTRFTLDDLGGELSERALVAFLRHLPPDAETAAALAPGKCGWSRTDMLLARICEDVEMLMWMEACRASKHRKPKRPKRIPRPGVKSDEKHIGRNPIPITEFDSWYGGEG